MLMMGAAAERCDSVKQRRRGRGTETEEEMEGGEGGGPSVARLWRVPNA